MRQTASLKAFMSNLHSNTCGHTASIPEAQYRRLTRFIIKIAQPTCSAIYAMKSPTSNIKMIRQFRKIKDEPVENRTRSS